MTGEERRWVDEESTRWMVAGMEAMERAAWREAEGYFGKAGELRDRLPWREDAEAAWMVAAAWLNHGDVMMRGGDERDRERAVVSFDRAIAAMGHVPLEENPAFVERLVLAWLNRATACTEMGDAEGAAAGFAEVDALLEKWGRVATPVRRFLTAMLHVNRARLEISMGHPLAAWQDVREGLEFLRPLQVTGETARAGIQARSIGCRALALLLDEPGGVEKVGDWIAVATDSAEEALALVRASGFRDEWVADLVRYGAKIYQACQPHFLAEFLTEWLGKGGPFGEDVKLREEMRASLWRAVAEVERGVLRFPQDTEFVEGRMRLLKRLQAGLAALG